jgi:histidinol-phosphate phosphatase family protein
LRNGSRLTAYQSREYIKDAGTRERLAAATADVASGRVARGSLRTPAAAVFLDRDGTLTDDPDYITDPDQVHLFAGVSKAIHALNRSEYVVVMLTNQPVVARGETDERGLKLIHNRLEQILGRDRAYLDAIYYCPHHPDRGFPGENVKYKIRCACRKPALGMIECATADMNIDLTRSWSIGDASTDVEMARRAGIRSVLVGTGQAGRDGRFPQRTDFEFPNVGAAIDFILDGWPAIEKQASEIAHHLRPGDIVLIGGLARSGKSTFASTLAWTMRRAKTAGKVISLDGWVKPVDQRAQGSVVDRFDIEKINLTLGTALAEGGDIVVPLYDRIRRQPGNGYSLTIEPEDIIILEGVIALLLNPNSPRRIVRIYVQRDEHIRYDIMAEDYRARKFTDEQFAELYAARQFDEAPIITKTRFIADFVIDTP